MDRVIVVGCGGSGKSYVARELARLLDAPITHLDAVYFDDQWNRLAMHAFEARQRDLVAAPRWVIDGNYNATLHVRLQAADTVVFLDMPTITCLWGVLSRQIRHGPGQNAGNGVFNHINRDVLRYIVGYRSRMRPRVLTKIVQHAGHANVITLTSQRGVRRFVLNVAGHSGRLDNL